MSLDLYIDINREMELLRKLAIQELDAREAMSDDYTWFIAIPSKSISIYCNKLDHPRIHAMQIEEYGMVFQYRVTLCMSRSDKVAGLKTYRNLINEASKHLANFVAVYVDADFLRGTSRGIEKCVKIGIYKLDTQIFLGQMANWIVSNVDVDPPLDN